MSTPIVIQGLALGSSLAFPTTVDVSLFEVTTTVPLGTTVYALATDDYWQLKVSTASPSASVLVVAGSSGLRWIKVVAGGSGVTSVTAAGQLTASASTGAITLTGPGTGTLVTKVGDAQTWDFVTGIVGNNLGRMHIKGEILADASPHSFDLRPNGSAPTTSDGLLLTTAIGSVTTANINSDLYIGLAGSSLTTVFDIVLDLKSGRMRYYHCQAETNNGANNYAEQTTVAWRDTATAVTSMQIHGSDPASIKAGSFVVYWFDGITA